MFVHQAVLLILGLGARLAVTGTVRVLPAPEAFDGDLGVELEAIALVAIAEGLVGEELARREMEGALGDGEGVVVGLAYPKRTVEEGVRDYLDQLCERPPR